MDDDRAMETLEALDRWLEDEDEGVVPAEILEARGIRLRPAEEMNDAELHDELWKAIGAMVDIGMYLERTDHLSDRELYENIESEPVKFKDIGPYRFFFTTNDRDEPPHIRIEQSSS